MCILLFLSFWFNHFIQESRNSYWVKELSFLLFSWNEYGKVVSLSKILNFELWIHIVYLFYNKQYKYLPQKYLVVTYTVEQRNINWKKSFHLKAFKNNQVSTRLMKFQYLFHFIKHLNKYITCKHLFYTLHEHSWIWDETNSNVFSA